MSAFRQKHNYMPYGLLVATVFLLCVAVVAGCAHRGVVNILAAAKAYLGEGPDALFGGFHLFELRQGETADALIDATGKALLPGKTVYYTGHCTGAYAYGRLSAILGERLRPLTGGTVAEI